MCADVKTSQKFPIEPAIKNIEPVLRNDCQSNCPAKAFLQLAND